MITLMRLKILILNASHKGFRYIEDIKYFQKCQIELYMMSKY